MEPLNAQARVRAHDTLTPTTNWADLEDSHQQHTLLLASGSYYADELWWSQQVDLTAEHQPLPPPFRRSMPQTDDFAIVDGEQSNINLYAWIQGLPAKKKLSDFEQTPLPALAPGVNLWLRGDYQKQICDLAADLAQDIESTCKLFDVMTLGELSDDQTGLINSVFGFYRAW